MEIEFKYAVYEDAYIESIINLGKEWDDEEESIKRFKRDIYSKLQDNIYCPYCRRRLRRNREDQIDHIIYKADYKNFTFQPKNLVLACKRCNNKKLSQNVLNDEYQEAVKTLQWREYPYDKKYYKIIHPYLDKYSEHIKLENDIFYMVHNNSSKGLNTIKMMKLNKFDFIEERVKECDSSSNYISISTNIKNPVADELVLGWAKFLLKEHTFQKIIFDILISFENSKHNKIIIPYEQYIKIKEAIQNGSKCTEELKLICSANLNFVKLINSINDETIVSQAIDQLEQFYNIKDISTELGFKYSLFIALIFLVKQKEGCYNKGNISKYLTS